MSDKETLLPNNATEQEGALEQTTSRVADVPVPLRSLWNPDTCPADLLPWLAWALSLDSWKPYWSTAVKRQRIKQAIEIQRKKGTAKSVRDVVQSFGGSVALREWWQLDPPGTPHTFELVLTVDESVPNSADFQQDIIDEVSRTKPVRSHFTLTTGLTSEAGLGLYGAARTVTYRRLDFEEA